MIKHFQYLLFILICLVSFGDAFSQNNYGENPEDCKIKLSEFFEYAKNKDYQYAYEPWLWTFENCAESSKNIYKYGLLIAEDRYTKATGAQKEIESKLIDKVYTKRIENFPDNLGKTYSDWAISLEDRNAGKEKVFEKLELAFKSDPTQMSIKNLARYFQEVNDRNKETDTQKVFDTYDDALDAVNSKIDYHSKALDELNEKVSKNVSLSSAENIDLKNHEINLRGLGQIETILDNIIDEIVTCDKLIPLYTKNLESYKTDAKWLRRAASRLNAKECTESDIYRKLVEAYVNVNPSPEAYIFYHDLLQKLGKTSDQNYLQKAINLENDPYKKADLLYRIALTLKNRSKSQSRDYAKQALKHRPSMGRAYLLIASLYASSANACGTKEFDKRMTYVAALNKALQAKSIDPSISKLADKYIDSYRASAPTKKDVFLEGLKSGDPFTVNCWIGETVKIP